MLILGNELKSNNHNTHNWDYSWRIFPEMGVGDMASIGAYADTDQ
jgi:hypothetical protein